LCDSAHKRIYYRDIIIFKIARRCEMQNVHEKKDFAEGFKILLDIDLKIILLDHQNNFVEP